MVQAGSKRGQTWFIRFTSVGRYKTKVLQRTSKLDLADELHGRLFRVDMVSLIVRIQESDVAVAQR